MLTMIPHSQGKRSSPAGGRIRSSCGYHHQRHQACHDTCEGRKTHPPGPHPPVRDKFSVGCTTCQAYFSEQHQEILSPVTKRLNSGAQSQGQGGSPSRSPSPPSTTPSPTGTNQNQLTNLPSFTTPKFEDFTSIAGNVSLSPTHPPKSPPQQKLATLAHEVEYELLQQHQLDLMAKRRQFEQEEQLLQQYRQQLDKMRQQQDTERQRIQQHQQVLDYQKSQQEMELQRIHQYQRELDDVRREQEMQRQILKQQQIEIAQARMEFDQLRLLQKKQEGTGAQQPTPASLTSPFSPLTISLAHPMVMGEKSHSPNPTSITSHPMEEENAVHDRMVHVTSSNKRPLSDVMGNEAEEASHKSNTRRSG